MTENAPATIPDDPAILAKMVAESMVPPESRHPDWNLRWATFKEVLDTRDDGPNPVFVEIAKMDYEHYSKEVSERLQFQQELGTGALKGLTIVNGGAIVALFTFLGNTGAGVDRDALWWAMALFGGGLTATLVGYIGGYFSQANFMISTLHQMWDTQRQMAGIELKQEHLKPLKVGNIALWSAIGAAILGLGGFVSGSIMALQSILG